MKIKDDISEELVTNKKTSNVPYIFLLPVILFMICIFIYPLYLTFKYSLSESSFMDSQYIFIGIKNFYNLFTDVNFIETIKRTFLWTALSLSLKIFLGLGLALLLSKNIKGIKIYRFLLLIPWAIPSTAAAIIWSWIYDGNYGYLNFFLEKFCVINNEVAWLGQRNTAFICTAITDAWAGISFVALSFLAGVQSIPQSMYEAAKIDGANKIQIFFKITLPQIKKLILVITTLTFIWTFNSFNIIWVLTKGGPVDATETIMIKIYREAFGKFNIGMSSTMSVVVFCILIVISIFYWNTLMKNEEEV